MIPNFDHNHVLPPHIGDPRRPTDVSPYLCSLDDFCTRFSTSPDRIDILIRFVEFRLKVYDLDLVGSFQWLDGSFLENIEASEKRAPRDIDVLTFYERFNNPSIPVFAEFSSPVLAKNNYKVDHYPIEYGYSPSLTVELTRYWVQLFCHNRAGIWKGMVRLNFDDKVEDERVLNKLRAII